MSINDGGSAFPEIQTCLGYNHLSEAHFSDTTSYGGMTLRDYFAAKAMQGFLANEQNGNKDALVISKWAYKQADAMLAARGFRQ